MAIDVTRREPQTLSLQVAEEIRVAMLRRGITGGRLAQELGVSPAWVSYRLTGAQPIDLNDLERIAAAIGVDVLDLFPAKARQQATGRYPTDRPAIDPLAARVVATAGEPRPSQQRTMLLHRPAHSNGRLDHPRHPDRSARARRPISLVGQPARESS